MKSHNFKELAEKYGVDKWFLIAGGIVVLATVLCLVIPSVRNCDKGK